MASRHPRPSRASRLLSVLLTFLPICLLITAVALACIGASRKDWTYRQKWTPDPLDPKLLPGDEYRGPWWSCSWQADSNSSIGWSLSCSNNHAPWGLCDFDAVLSDKPNSPIFCQHLSLAAQLLYAGCALVTAALVVVLPLTIVSLPHVIRTGAIHVVELPWARTRRQREGPAHGDRAGADKIDFVRPSSHSPMSYVALLLTLLAAFGALSLFTGMLIACLALGVMQYTQVDWMGGAVQDPLSTYEAGPWLLGQPAGLVAAAAMLAGVASYSVGMVWESPRVGILETHAEVRSNGVEPEEQNRHEAKATPVAAE